MRLWIKTRMAVQVEINDKLISTIYAVIAKSIYHR